MTGDIEVVFLDAGGTLFEVRGSVGQIYSRFGLLMAARSIPEKSIALSSRLSKPRPLWPSLVSMKVRLAEQNAFGGRRSCERR